MNSEGRNPKKMKPGRIVIIDDEPLTLKNLRRILEKEGHSVSTFSNPIRAMKRIEESPCDLVISDVKMPYMDGVTLLDHVKRSFPDIGVILITGYASLDGAVEATKLGAYHYLEKPFTPEQIRDLTRHALKEKFLREQSFLQSRRRQEKTAHPLIIGDSPKMAQVAGVIDQIAPTECNVLITGESGTGKELIARALHAGSQRREKAFMAFNCGAFSEELIANELFGHEKDAFTGASSRRQGLLAAANGGTLFLDEISDMPPSMQVKLLRVIQEREFLPLGGTKPTSLDVRIVSASAKDLKTAAKDGAFRQDLYFRLNVVGIDLPRLAERRKDIPLLAYHFLERFRKQTNRKIRAISKEAMNLLSNYAFPGNVRELENILERAVALCHGEVIQTRDLPPDLARLKLYSYQRPAGDLLNLAELEKDYIRHILEITGGVRTRASQILGIDRASLWRKMKKYGLE
jgi:DNA-binding NtrC family response regulator